ncbi:hypothetical protein [Paenibacillus massiliensis]|uniref:hypothetical protein n=1 Tax=Paenibacillus massiliensis TaxID=225917 RepID=UPI00046E84D3|nr:hypothetical protein [Paenibacillus massiliensis]
MKKPVFVKYNRNRLPSFQLKTSLFNDNGNVLVEKKALGLEAASHIHNILDNYVKLNDKYPDINFAEAKLVNSDTITFNYVDGMSLDEHLWEAVSSRDLSLIIKYMNCYKDFLRKFEIINVNKFRSNPEFQKVFACAPEFLKVECIAEANIDLTFDNIFLHDNQFTIIDYEWVFETYIPLNYVFFRSISRFFWKYGEYLSDIISENDIFEMFNLSPEEVSQFRTMEEGFQNYVLGSEKLYGIGVQYSKDNKTIEELNEANLSNNNKLIEQQNKLNEMAHKIGELERQRSELVIELERTKEMQSHGKFEIDKLLAQEEMMRRKQRILREKLIQSQKEYEALQNIHKQIDDRIEQKINILLMSKNNPSFLGKFMQLFKFKQQLECEKEALVEERNRVLLQKDQVLKIKDEKINVYTKRIEKLEKDLSYMGSQDHEMKLQNNHLSSLLHDAMEELRNTNLAFNHIKESHHQLTLEYNELIVSYNQIQEKYHQLDYDYRKLKKSFLKP